MKLASATILCSLALFASVVHAQEESAGRKILVLGVGGTEGVANNPNDPHGIAEFTQNFEQTVTLSFRDDRAKRPGFGFWASDVFLATRDDLAGNLSAHAWNALTSLRLSPGDTVIAHSWGAMELMYAIREGVVQPPGRVVFVNPPLISPEGTREWRAFAERFPRLAVDVYIGKEDFLNRMRVTGADIKYRDIRNRPSALGDALMPFVIPEAPAQIRVRMYPGDHRLLTFLDFAARTGQYGLTPRSVGGNVEIPAGQPPAFVQKQLFQSNETGYGYLFETGPGLARAQALARTVGIGREPQTRELLRVQAQERAQRSAQELAKARWEFVSLLIATACETPYVLREFESRGLVPGIRIPLSDIRVGYARESGSMSKCQREIFEEIIANPSNLSILALADRGEKYRRDHNPVRVAERKIDDLLESMARAFSQSMESILDALTPSPSSYSSGGDGSGDRQRGGRDRDSPGIEFHSPTYEQLKGGTFRWN